MTQGVIFAHVKFTIGDTRKYRHLREYETAEAQQRTLADANAFSPTPLTPQAPYPGGNG